MKWSEIWDIVKETSEEVSTIANLIRSLSVIYAFSKKVKKKARKHKDK